MAVGGFVDGVDPALDVDGVGGGLGVVHGQGEAVDLVVGGLGGGAAAGGLVLAGAGAQTHQQAQGQHQKEQDGDRAFHSSTSNSFSLTELDSPKGIIMRIPE